MLNKYKLDIDTCRPCKCTQNQLQSLTIQLHMDRSSWIPTRTEHSKVHYERCEEKQMHRHEIVWYCNAFSTCKVRSTKDTDLNKIYCYGLIRCRRPSLLSSIRRTHKSAYTSDGRKWKKRKEKKKVKSAQSNNGLINIIK